MEKAQKSSLLRGICYILIPILVLMMLISVADEILKSEYGEFKTKKEFAQTEYFSRQYFQTIISDLRYIENLKEENNQLYSKYIQIQDDNLKIYYENTYYDRDISSGISYVIKNKKDGKIYTNIKINNVDEEINNIQFHDKYVDDVLSLDDFEVSDTKTNKVINKKNLQLAAKPLNIDGTAAVISYTVNGKTYSASKTVYPTLVIEKISAELVAENKHIGSKLKKEDFKVIGTNNKKEDVELKEFTLSHTVLKDAENDVKIEYVSSAGTVSTTLHISVTENFVVGVEAKYTGQSVFAGEDVDEDKFEVYAVWDDDAKTKVEDYRVSQASVSEDSSVVSVSITDEQGKTFYTDVRIKSINYVVDIDSVAYIGQDIFTNT